MWISAQHGGVSPLENAIAWVEFIERELDKVLEILCVVVSGLITVKLSVAWVFHVIFFKGLILGALDF